MQKGILIDFEGGEKVGKTTQIRKAKECLESLGYPVLVTHEPGGGDPHIREKLLDMKGKVTPEQELDLFCQDRKLHVDNLLRPSLETGTVVLLDRFEPSTIAYQGYARGISLDLIRQKSAEARGEIWPDVIILLDADPAIALKREEATSRFDAEKIEFHQKVRAGFLAQAKEDTAHWRIIDASSPIEEVWEDVKKEIDSLTKK